MGVLESSEGHRATLAPRTLIGRSRRCLVRIQHSCVSGEHAAITWVKDKWFVHDLGSRNGTLVGTRRVEAHAKVPLRVGTRLAFGECEWALVSDAPPLTRAVRRDTEEVVEQDEDGVLILAAEPEVVAVVPEGEGWILDSVGLPIREVHDHQTVEAAGARWVLELCQAADVSIDTTDQTRAIRIHDVTMRFLVSRDSRHVAVQLVHERHGVILLPKHSYHQVLLALARQRLSDQQAGFPVEEAGWMPTEDLQKALKMNRTRVNTELHRARRALKGHGVARVQDLIERRAQNQQLRIGIQQLEIEMNPAIPQ